MQTIPVITRHLAAALAVAAVLSACRPSPDAPAATGEAAPVADVEGTALPPTVEPVVVDGTSDDLDWTVAGQDEIASAAADEARDAARRYIGRDSVAAPTVEAEDGEAAAVPGGSTDNVATTASGGAEPQPRVEGQSRRPAVAAARTPPPAPAARTEAPDTPPVAPDPAPVAAAADPAQARSLNQRAIGLINGGRPADAIPLLERAVALQPRDAEMLGNLGYAYMLSGRHERARARLQSALDLSPTRSATWLNLGQTYAELGQRDTAVDAVVRGYRYSTRKPSVRSALQRAATGNRHSAAWREAAGLALARISG
jgi:tetratricopeptide (TPR) repeat protein